jgi:hypothetical protein
LPTEKGLERKFEAFFVFPPSLLQTIVPNVRIFPQEIRINSQFLNLDNHLILNLFGF